MEGRATHADLVVTKRFKAPDTLIIPLSLRGHERLDVRNGRCRLQHKSQIRVKMEKDSIIFQQNASWSVLVATKRAAYQPQYSDLAVITI